MKTILAALMLGAVALPAWADEGTFKPRPGPNKELFENNCAACHSLDYIQMNSPFMSPKVWEAEVTKMIKTFGAPIDDADAKKITEYLNAAYGG